MRWNSSGECICGREVPHCQNIVDRCPIGIVDDGVPVIVPRLSRHRAAGNDPHGIDIDLAALLSRHGPHAADMFAICSKVMPSGIVEKSASQFRIAKAWPVADGPAFMIKGREPP